MYLSFAALVLHSALESSVEASVDSVLARKKDSIAEGKNARAGNIATTISRRGLIGRECEPTPSFKQHNNPDVGILGSCGDGGILDCIADGSSSLGGRCRLNRRVAALQEPYFCTFYASRCTEEGFYCDIKECCESATTYEESVSCGTRLDFCAQQIELCAMTTSPTSSPMEQTSSNATNYVWAVPIPDRCGFAECCKDLATFQEVVKTCDPFAYNMNYRFSYPYPASGKCSSASLCGPPDWVPHYCQLKRCCKKAYNPDEEEACYQEAMSTAVADPWDMHAIEAPYFCTYYAYRCIEDASYCDVKECCESATTNKEMLECEAKLDFCAQQIELCNRSKSPTSSPTERVSDAATISVTIVGVPDDNCGFAKCCQDLTTFRDVINTCDPFAYGMNLRLSYEWPASSKCYSASFCGSPDWSPQNCQMKRCCTKASTPEEEEACYEEVMATTSTSSTVASLTDETADADAMDEDVMMSVSTSSTVASLTNVTADADVMDEEVMTTASTSSAVANVAADVDAMDEDQKMDADVNAKGKEEMMDHSTGAENSAVCHVSAKLVWFGYATLFFILGWSM